MDSATKPLLGAMILLHREPADETAPCMYCGKEQPWGPMEPCDGPMPLREDRALLDWLDAHPTGGRARQVGEADASGWEPCELLANTWELEGRTIREAIRTLIQRVAGDSSE